MAQITQAEFNQAIAALAEHHGVERLRDHLARMNAFTSRRGLNSAAAIAERLYLLTGGLRRQVPGTYAFSSLWADMVGKRIGEDGEKKLEAIADEVNACLAPDDSIVDGKEEALDQAGSPLAGDDARALLVQHARRMFEFMASDPARTSLLFQRTIPGFEPSPDSFAPAVELVARLHAFLQEQGIDDPDAADAWTALISGLANQQIANDPGGQRWGRMRRE